MKVLIACEFSGVVRDAFAAKGHDAMSCDLLDTDTPGKHYTGDVLDIIGDGWDLMIAHPPCTYLARAGCRWLYPGGKLNVDRYKKGRKAKLFFDVLLNADIPRIAVENPVPQKIFKMPEPTQIIHPWQFGHEVQKTTLLWLKGLPNLEPTKIVGKGEYFYDKVNGWRHTKWFMKDTNAKRRSITFQGIADAMAAQWG